MNIDLLFSVCKPHSLISAGPALSTSTERSEDHSYLLNAVVDISVTKHKYVILDVCQRLPASVLAQLAQSLNVPEEKIREISTDFMMVEEKYYQV